jgi:transposase
MKRKKRNRDDEDEEGIVLQCEKEKDTTVVTSLASHVTDPAVLKMVEEANEAWDVVTCLGNDAVHSYCLHALTNKLPLPNLEDKAFWQFALGYTIKRSTQQRGQSEELREAFLDHFEKHFGDHDTTRKGFHDNFVESMATAEATNNTVYNKWECLNDHLIIYLRGKYQLRNKKMARALAYRIVAKEPLAFDSIHQGLVEQYGMQWVQEVIRLESEARASFLSQEAGQLRYRYFMTSQLDTMAVLVEGDDEARPIKRFTLIPTHGCGSTRFAILCGQTMSNLLRKKDYPEFYEKVKASGRAGKLETYFNAPKKKGWQRGRQVRSNGIELHTLFEKNKDYCKNGTTKKQKKCFRTEESDYDVPTRPIYHFDHCIAAVDPGYHNFFSCVRPTREVDEKGQRVMEKRFVTKKWYDRRSGRSKVRKKAAVMTNRAQKRKLLDGITNHTLKTTDPVAFRLAINARRDAYTTLYAFYNNKRLKRLKFAMRKREQQTIEQLVDYISWGGEVVNVFGDCSKTTGFKSSTPGGPLKKIQRLMVKKGLRVVEEKEAYSTKASVCCHGYANKEMKCGQSPDTFKQGKYKECPDKKPSKVHGILVCQKCKRTWNRDVVGATNILDIYLARMEGHPRPERFTRAYWQILSDSQLQVSNGDMGSDDTGPNL